jgi:hypothetical protein
MSVILKTVECVNAAGQSVLRQGARYEVIVDVKRAATGRFPSGDAPFASGYVVRPVGDMRCLTGVMNRERFKDVAASSTGDY